MMFSNVGHRPRTQQHIRLGATQDGKLTAIRHDFLSETSQLDDFIERCGEQTPFLYSCPNLVVTTGMVRRNVGAPAPMRGPGAVPGLFALESAMDELAIKLKMDPLELRLKNDAERDEGKNLPFSSRHLKECYTTGAEKIGWKQRTPKSARCVATERSLAWVWRRIMVRSADSLHRQCGTVPQRTRMRSLRHAGHRHRDIHHFRPGHSREDGRAARSHRRLPRRQLIAERTDIRRFDGDQRVLPAATSAVNQAVTRLLHIATIRPIALPWHGARNPGDHQRPGASETAAAGCRRSYHSGRQLTANGVPFEEVLKMANLSGLSANGKTSSVI